MDKALDEIIQENNEGLRNFTRGGHRGARRGFQNFRNFRGQERGTGQRGGFNTRRFDGRSNFQQRFRPRGGRATHHQAEDRDVEMTVRRGGINRQFPRRNNENRDFNYGFTLEGGKRRDNRMNRNPNWRPREYNAANDHEFDDHSKASNFRPVSNRLFISNLNPSLSNFDLKVSIETKDNKKIFSRYGDLTRCGLHWDILGNSRGTADIEYETIEDAQEAIRSLDNYEINGQRIFVQFARKRFVSHRREGLRLGRRRNENRFQDRANNDRYNEY